MQVKSEKPKMPEMPEMPEENKLDMEMITLRNWTKVQARHLLAHNEISDKLWKSSTVTDFENNLFLMKITEIPVKYCHIGIEQTQERIRNIIGKKFNLLEAYKVEQSASLPPTDLALQ